MKVVFMITTDSRGCGRFRRVKVRGVAQGSDQDMIAEARMKCHRYLKLFERPEAFDVALKIDA